MNRVLRVNALLRALRQPRRGWRHLLVGLLMVAALLLTVAPGYAATFTVSTAADLRIALAGAANGDIIVLAANIALDASTTYPASGTNGLPLIDGGRGLTVEGNGFTISRSAGSFRFFYVEAGSTLKLVDVTLNGGLANGPGQAGDGGAVFNLGTLVLDNAKFTSNTASLDGGAIYNQGTLTADLAGFTGNTAAGGSVWAGGGAVYNFGGTVTIRQSVFTGNTMTGGTDSGGGGAIAHMSRLGSNGVMTIDGTTFSNNSTNWSGGAIFNVAGPDGGSTSMTITNSTFTGNSAIAGGGIYTTEDNTTLTLSTSVVTGNTSTGNVTDRGGGGIYSRAELVNIDNSRIENNTAIRGGGIYNWEFDGTRFATLTMKETLVANNSATTEGAGLYNRNRGRATLTNVTFSGNTNPIAGGGIFNFEGGVATLDNVTFAGNTDTSDGDAVFNRSFAGRTSVVNFSGTIVTGVGLNCQSVNGAVFNDNGGNISNDASCGIATVADPLLNALANNGGFSRTHSLQAGSPALALAGACGLLIDQRGFPRAGTCDAGAHQNGGTPAQISYTVSSNSIAEAGGFSQVTVTVDNTGGSSAAAVTAFFTVGGTASRTEDYTDGGLGTGTLTFNVAAGNTASQSYTITGTADTLIEGNETIALTLGFNGFATLAGGANQTVTITDGAVLPPASVSVAPNPLALDEGASGQYIISLARTPNIGETVTVTLSSAAGEVGFNPASAIFTSVSSQTATIDVTITDNAINDGNRAATITHAVASTGGAYTGITAPDLTVNITDDDVPGVSIAPLALALAEGDPTTTSYVIGIGSRPAVGETVTVTLTDASGELVIPASVTFTNADFADRTVTVGITDNSLLDGDRTLTITHAVSSSLGGSGYNSLAVPPSVDVSITDDDTPGVVINPTAIGIVEGGTATYTISLATQPLPGETITVELFPDDPTVTAPASVSFTNTDFAPRTVDVVVPDNALVDGTRQTIVSHTVSSSTPTSPYNALGGLEDVVITITDDESPGVVVNPTAFELVAGGDPGTYTLVLTQEPSAPVTVTLAFSGTCGVSPTTLTFNPTSVGSDPWDTPQAVTVNPTGVPGAICTITHTATGGNYAGVTVSDTVVTLIEDPGVITPVIPQVNAFDPAISKLGFLTPGQVGVTGERLEWVVTVSNVGGVAGTDVVITDTLIDALRVVRVDSTEGTVNIDGQQVSVSYATLAPGQTVQFTIITDVLSGGEITNEACLTAANFGGERCTSALTASNLPETGESPWWRDWVLVLLASGVLVAGGLLRVAVPRRAG